MVALVRVISFYTKDTPYVEEALRLVGSCANHSIPTSILPRPNLGNWSLNCHQKPGFIREQLHAAEEPVLWLDADAEVMAPLDDAWIRDAGVDFAASWRPMSSHSELLSGTTWWNFTEGAFKLLTEWEKECRMNPGVWDQKHLQYALGMCPDVQDLRLPIAWTWIEDLFRCENPDVEPIVVHHQASRRLRKKI